MRYIEKNNPPKYLLAWKDEQKQAGCNLLYNDFPYKERLNKDLRQEQHSICCYCQRKLDHFQGDLVRGSHNEHLYPENIPGDQLSHDLQVEYTNIYACCIDSRGCEKRLQYCGEIKSNNRIPHLIQNPECSNYFRYNILGEIIPNGVYGKWEDYVNNKEELEGVLYEAFLCIKILNLNCITLKLYRYQILQSFITVISHWTADKLDNFISSYESAAEYQELINMKLQYMRQRYHILTT